MARTVSSFHVARLENAISFKCYVSFDSIMLLTTRFKILTASIS